MRASLLINMVRAQELAEAEAHHRHAALIGPSDEPHQQAQLPLAKPRHQPLEQWGTRPLPGPALRPHPEGQPFQRLKSSTLATQVKGVRYLRRPMHPLARIHAYGMRGGR